MQFTIDCDKIISDMFFGSFDKWILFSMGNFKKTIFNSLVIALVLCCKFTYPHIITLDTFELKMGKKRLTLILCGDFHKDNQVLNKANSNFFDKIIKKIYSKTTQKIKFSMEHIIGKPKRHCVINSFIHENYKNFRNINFSFPDIRNINLGQLINIQEKILKSIQPFSIKYFGKESISLIEFEENLNKKRIKFLGCKNIKAKKAFFVDNKDGFIATKQYIHHPNIDGKKISSVLSKHIKNLNAKSEELVKFKPEQNIIKKLIKKIKKRYKKLKKILSETKNKKYSEFILKIIQKEKSFQALINIHQNYLLKLFFNIADTCLLVDIIKSTKENNYEKIIVITGAKHTDNIKNIIFKNPKIFQAKHMHYSKNSTFEFKTTYEKEFFKAFGIICAGNKMKTLKISCKKKGFDQLPYVCKSGALLCPQCRDKIRKFKEKIRNKKK